MRKNGKEKEQSERERTMEKYAAEGKAIAYINEIVTFVEGAIPGDVADVPIKRKRKNHGRTAAIEGAVFAA